MIFLLIFRMTVLITFGSVFSDFIFFIRGAWSSADSLISVPNYYWYSPLSNYNGHWISKSSRRNSINGKGQSRSLLNSKSLNESDNCILVLSFNLFYDVLYLNSRTVHPLKLQHLLLVYIIGCPVKFSGILDGSGSEKPSTIQMKKISHSQSKAILGCPE